MAAFDIKLMPAAKAALRDIPQRDRPPLDEAIRGLACNPDPPTARTLKGDPRDRRKLRLGDYRIDRAQSRVVIILLGHRRSIYKQLRRVQQG